MHHAEYPVERINRWDNLGYLREGELCADRHPDRTNRPCVPAHRTTPGRVRYGDPDSGSAAAGQRRRGHGLAGPGRATRRRRPPRRGSAGHRPPQGPRDRLSGGHRGAGIVSVEVKGGEVWHDGTAWRQRRGGREFTIEPVRQAREACCALRGFVESDPRWTQGRLRWDHLVVLPHSALPQDFNLPDCPRWKAVDRDELGSLAVRLKTVLSQQNWTVTTDGRGYRAAADRAARARTPAARRRRPRPGERERRRPPLRTAGRHPQRRSATARVEIRGAPAAARLSWPSNRPAGWPTPASGWR